jgi:hypothetical protein
VIVQVGPPIDPAPELASYAAEPGTAVRRLTARIAAALAEVTLNHASWEEARLVGRASALLTETRPGCAPTFAEVWPVRQRVWRTYQALRRDDPARAEQLAREVSRYDQELGARGLTPEEALLVADASGLATRWQTVAGLVVAAPLAFAGVLLNLVPFRLIDWIARQATHTADEPATYKVLGALIFFPLAWAAQAALVWLVAGPTTAVLTAVGAPLTGYTALRWIERFRDARARRRRHGLAVRATGMVALAEQRDRLRESMRMLLASPPNPVSGTS